MVAHVCYLPWRYWHNLPQFKSSLKACNKNSSAKSSRGSKEICTKATEHVYAGRTLSSSYHSFNRLKEKKTNKQTQKRQKNNPGKNKLCSSLVLGCLFRYSHDLKKTTSQKSKNSRKDTASNKVHDLAPVVLATYPHIKNVLWLIIGNLSHKEFRTWNLNWFSSSPSDFRKTRKKSDWNWIFVKKV